MAYCPNCGKEIEKNGRYCTRCGAEIKSDGAQQKGAPQENRPGGEKNAKSSIIITGMICATVIIVVIAVALILNMSGQPEPEPKEAVSLASETEKDLPSVTSEPEQTEISSTPSATSEPGQEEISSTPSATSEPGQEEISSTPSAMPEQDSQENPVAAEENPPLKEWPERDTLPFSTEKFSMELPGTWAEHYSLEKGEDFYALYNVENADAGYGGFLFSIEMYQKDGEWEFLPSYQFLEEKDGVYYVATFPTDVQFDMENEANQKIYNEMREDIDGILKTFAVK